MVVKEWKRATSLLHHWLTSFFDVLRSWHDKTASSESIVQNMPMFGFSSAVLSSCHVLWLHILFGCHRTPKISESDYLRHTGFPQYSCFHWFVLHLTHTYAYAMFLTHFITEPRTSDDPWVILTYLDSLWLDPSRNSRTSNYSNSYLISPIISYLL
jgi:hypothetical protein